MYGGSPYGLSPYGALAAALDPLVAVSQPTDVTAYEGDAVVFYFAATGGYPQINYQWYKVGEGALSGETGNILSLSSVSIDYDDGAQFYCIATDSLGQTLQSNTADLTVVAQPACTITDVRILGNDGVWYSMMGQDGEDGDSGDVIDDSAPKVAKTYSSFKIELLLAGKADKSDIPEPDILVVDGGAPDSVHFVTADGGEPSSVHSVFHIIDGGSL